MGKSAPVGRLRVLQSQHSRKQGSRLLDVPRQRGPDAADVSGEFAADGMVFGLSSQHGDGTAAVGQGLRHELATRGQPVRNWQAIAKRTQYSEHDRADELLDVPSLDGWYERSRKQPRRR